MDIDPARVPLTLFPVWLGAAVACSVVWVAGQGLGLWALRLLGCGVIGASYLACLVAWSAITHSWLGVVWTT